MPKHRSPMTKPNPSPSKKSIGTWKSIPEQAVSDFDSLTLLSAKPGPDSLGHCSGKSLCRLSERFPTITIPEHGYVFAFWWSGYWENPQYRRTRCANLEYDQFSRKFLHRRIELSFFSGSGAPIFFIDFFLMLMKSSNPGDFFWLGENWARKPLHNCNHFNDSRKSYLVHQNRVKFFLRLWSPDFFIDFFLMLMKCSNPGDFLDWMKTEPVSLCTTATIFCARIRSGFSDLPSTRILGSPPRWILYNKKPPIWK